MEKDLKHILLEKKHVLLKSEMRLVTRYTGAATPFEC
jgi:hypothetical protein